MDNGNRIEAPVRLSRSVLWHLQRRYYDRMGPRAWSEREVPTQITTNPYVANAYAGFFVGWLRDLLRADALNASEPLYLIEAGAGSGRFGFRLAKALERRLPKLPGLPPIVVVLTDFTEENLAYWPEHPAMKPLVESGQVDFARLDLDAPAPIELRVSGHTIGPDPTANPVGLVMNYVIDSTRQDCFRIRDGRLYETRVGVSVSEAGVDRDDVIVLEKMTVDYEDVEVDGAYYGDPSLDELLAIYQRSITDGFVLIPQGPLATIRALREASGGRLAVVAGDKAVRHPHEWEGRERPYLARHGSISLTANFHAVQHLTEELGGLAWHSRAFDTSFTVSAFVLPGDEGSGAYEEARVAFEAELDDFGPASFHRLYDTARDVTEPALPLLIALLRLSEYDAATFLDWVDPLRELADEANPEQNADVAEILDEVWRRYYQVGDSDDLAFQIARVLYRLDREADAIAYYERSLVLDGEHPAVYYNIGLCQERLGRIDEARAAWRRALAIKPEYSKAKDKLKVLNGTVRSDRE